MVSYDSLWSNLIRFQNSLFLAELVTALFSKAFIVSSSHKKKMYK
jgi:hypothetical protein